MCRKILFVILLFISIAVSGKTKTQGISIDLQQPVTTNLIANGVQWSAYPHADSKMAEWGALMTPEKWTKVYKRLDYIRPGIVRVMDQAGWRYFKGMDDVGNPILDFQTDEMKALFNVLDYCQKNQIVVVFGEWGAPGFWKEPGNLNRADDPRWIHMITRYLDFLLRDKGYSCIQYYNLVNEPNGYWASVNGDWNQWRKGIQMLHDSIRSIGLEGKLRIAGPDVVVNFDNPASAFTGLEWVDETVSQLNDKIGLYDVHAYPDGESVRSGAFGTYYGNLREKVRKTGKKMIMGELGLKYSGALYAKNKALAEADPNASKDDSNMFVYDYFYGLDVADALIQAMNAGYEGVVAWDLDDAMHTQDDTGDKTRLKRWGMWNSLGTELCGKPEDENLRPWFYTWSLMCRFFPSGMTVVRSKVSKGCFVKAVTAFKGDSISIALLNNTPEEQNVALHFRPNTKAFDQYLYLEKKSLTDKQGFPIPIRTISPNQIRKKVTLPPHSFLVFTTIKH